MSQTTVRYAHTNLVARDWRRLADFYQRVFGCERQMPERDLGGDWLERGIAVAGAHVTGVHMRLPGYGTSGPTLEIFEYRQPVDAPAPPANRVGFGHIAFAVQDVPAIRDAALRAGGTAVGSVESVAIPGAGRITWTYVRDPEGNIVEVQHFDAEE
jgi:predicted enzyme related to lactoylglutathione lyase